MRTLLMATMILIGLETCLFAGKDEKLISDVAKSSASKRPYQRKTKPPVQAVLSAAANLAVAQGIPFKMSSYQTYNAQRQQGSMYDPAAEQFQLSRSKIEKFLTCKTCFYLDRKEGLAEPSSFPFSLNNAVDELQKNEHDFYRERQIAHPLCQANGLNLVPFKHPDMDIWRDAIHNGLKCKVEGTNIVLQGGVDDIWVNETTKELFIVDYKATSKTRKEDTINLDASWQDGYKRQAEIYQVLLRAQPFVQEQGYTVSNTAYFVYSNALRHLDDTDESGKVRHFENKLDFETKLLPYEGDASWVHATVVAAWECLQSETSPSDPIAQELSEKYCSDCKHFNGRAAILARKNK